MNSERMLLTPSRFSISLILLDPSSSISKQGKSKFSICVRGIYFFDFVTQQVKLLHLLQMGNVLNPLNVVVGKVEDFEVVEIF